MLFPLAHGGLAKDFDVRYATQSTGHLVFVSSLLKSLCRCTWCSMRSYLLTPPTNTLRISSGSRSMTRESLATRWVRDSDMSSLLRCSTSMMIVYKTCDSPQGLYIVASSAGDYSGLQAWRGIDSDSQSRCGPHNRGSP